MQMRKGLHEAALNLVKVKTGMSDAELLKALTERMLNDDTVPAALKEEIRQMDAERGDTDE